MTHHIDRRDMLKTTMALGAGIWVGSSTTPAHSAMAIDKMNIAFIGIGGRGKANLDGIARTRQNIVALCDVDDKRAGKAISGSRTRKNSTISVVCWVRWRNRLMQSSSARPITLTFIRR